MRQENRVAGQVILIVSEDAGFLAAAREVLETPLVQVIAPPLAETPARAKARQPLFILIEADKADAAVPGGSTLLESVKNSPYTANVPLVAVLPARSGEDAQLALFARGADDCLLIPENPELLGPRLQALARRFKPPQDAAETLAAEGLLIDLRARKVTVNDAPVALTRKEFDLLNMLLRKRGIVAYTTHLYHTVWGYGESSPVDSHTVKVHISSLRSKLGPSLGRKIVNLPGLGYRFDD